MATTQIENPVINSPFSTNANPHQLQAIRTTEGPLLIIAGPGSGKTFTLVERIVSLILERGVTPERLMVVTFTDKAAQELTTRISTRLNQLNIRFNLNEMYLGTFHSICLRWLEEYREFTRLKRNFTMMDQFDQHYFLYQRFDEYRAIPDIHVLLGDSARQSVWYLSETLQKYLNIASEEALDPATLIHAPDAIVRVLGQCYALYQRHLTEENALDFATIQYEALTLLRSQPTALAALREKITYLMVDEYQDTNTIQEKILLLLAGNLPNLCVVGDDDQGLYRFRGATIRNILQFKENFPPNACQQVSLTVNYRSHPDIINFYNQWILDQNWNADGKVFRFAKTIVPRQDTFPAMPTVLKLSDQTESGWQQEVLAFLQALRDQGQLSDWNQVAFLFKSVRTDKVVALAQFLESNDIPVYSPRSKQFFDREEIRLLIGAFIFLFPQFPTIRQWNATAHLEIWEYYDNECFALFAQAIRQPEHQDILTWAKATARQHYALTQNTDYNFSGLLYRLLQFPLFSRYLDETLLQGRLMESRAMRNIALFSQFLGKFEHLHHVSVLTPAYLERNLRELFNHFLRFLKDGGLDEYEDETEYAPSGCVSFLTIHQSKGLEFPVVLVGSLGSTPRKQYTELEAILSQGYLSRQPFEPLEQMKYYDFRRLFYTAFSRAQNLLVLTCQEISGRGRTPSSVFADDFDALPSWRDPAFRVADLPIAPVKDVELKQEYSFTSHLAVFENCAEQYRFFKELEFAPIRTNPILFGTVVHQTIEDIHKTVLRNEEQKLSPAQIEAWFDTNYAFLTKRERAYLTPYLKDRALQDVLRYYQRNQHDWSHIKDAEVDVSLVKDDYILTGKIDLIVGEQHTVEVVDFKSERKLDVNDPKDREKLDRYRRQLEVYAHIVEERTGYTVSKTHLYYTGEESGNPYITFPKDTKSIQQTIATFDEVVQRIEQRDFRIAARPAKLCEACDMRFYCDRKNWSFRES